MFTSCQKEDPNSTFEMKDSSKISKDEGRAIFAKALAKSMAKNPDFKEFIISEAQKKFNGDYDVLYAMVRNKMIGDKSFASILFENYTKKDDVLARTETEEILEDYFNDGILENDPYLTIYVPKVHFYIPELLDLETKVSIIESNTNEITTDFLTAYDGNMVEYLINAKNYPQNESIFVIKTNERVVLTDKATLTTVNGNNLLNTIFNGPPPPTGGPCDILQMIVDNLENNDNNIITINGNSFVLSLYSTFVTLLENCLENPPSPPQVPCTEPCDRDCWTAKDEIYDMQFTNYNSFKEACSWWDGDAEIFIQVFNSVLNSNGSTSEIRLVKVFEEEREAFFEHCNWFNGNCDGPVVYPLLFETFTWDLNNGHGDTQLISWWEEDEKDANNSEISFGVSAKFKAGVATLTIPIAFKIKFSASDDHMGDSLPEYCDDAITPGELYNTGTVKFHYRRRP